jgi:hypothetical protein
MEHLCFAFHNIVSNTAWVNFDLLRNPTQLERVSYDVISWGVCCRLKNRSRVTASREHRAVPLQVPTASVRVPFLATDQYGICGHPGYLCVCNVAFLSLTTLSLHLHILTEIVRKRKAWVMIPIILTLNLILPGCFVFYLFWNSTKIFWFSVTLTCTVIHYEFQLQDICRCPLFNLFSYYSLTSEPTWNDRMAVNDELWRIWK